MYAGSQGNAFRAGGEADRSTARIAVLSNPQAHGNKSRLAAIRAFCSENPGIVHVEVEREDDLGGALADILATHPKVLAINGGDGTVQAVLTKLYRVGGLDKGIPPIAVLPGGKTNLIAKDPGAASDAIRALERCCRIAENELRSDFIERQVIRLSVGDAPPVVGMFVGSGGLSDAIMHCRHFFYPTGLPYGVCHALEVLANLVSILTGWRAKFLPPPPSPVTISNSDGDRLEGAFQIVMATTLHRLILGGTAPLPEPGKIRLLAIERRRRTGLRIVIETLRGRLGRERIRGVHWLTGEQIRIKSRSVVMDGELIEPPAGEEAVLDLLPPVRLVDLSA